MDAPCPLCAAAEHLDCVAENDHAVAFHDAFPVGPGHTLVVSRRHVSGLFDLTDQEYASLWALVVVVKRTLDASHSPAGFNVGANVGPAAGQTVGHVHIHVIPRFVGDMPDPRGGVRWVLPAHADYWSQR